MNYLALLNHSFEEIKKCSENKKITKPEFIGEYIFEFTTYENLVLSLFAKKALEVCEAITNNNTFDYIRTEDGNLWYLIMVNMPFFEGKLEWGTSIRGAWWDLSSSKFFTLKSCGLFENGEQLLEIKFNENQWHEFIEAMIKFTNE